MSLTTEITALTSAARDLTQRVDGWVADADARITAAIRAIPQTSRTVYVDAANGDDSADGSADAPVASLRTAFGLQVPGGRTEIRLLSDVVLSDVLGVLSSTRIVGWDKTAASPVRRSFIVAGQYAQNIATAHNCCLQLHGYPLSFISVDYVMPSLDDPTVNTTASLEIITGGTVQFYDCSISAAAGAANSHLITPYSCLTVAHIIATALSPDVGPGTGRLFAGIAAGADPNSVWNINTNITQN